MGDGVSKLSRSLISLSIFLDKREKRRAKKSLRLFCQFAREKRMSEAEPGDRVLPSNRQVTIAELRDVMTLKGTEALEIIQDRYGGVPNLCSMLSSSPENGLKSEADVKKKREDFGANVIPPRPAKSFIALC